MKKLLSTAIITTTVLLSPASAGVKTDVLNTYADIARATYLDSLDTAMELQTATQFFLQNPTAKRLKNVQMAWIKARVPYLQTEVFRFANPMVDDWQGKVNASPLDEGMIDYVDVRYGKESESNPYYTANIIANEMLTTAGETLDASKINMELLQKLHKIGGVEANVATGYHAIEFLLWGQDLNGTEAGNGNRSYKDYLRGPYCINDNCDRRRDYLEVAVDLLVSDLAKMSSAWRVDGKARQALLQDEKAGIKAILTGMGSLSYGELAGERTKLALMLQDPEKEHDDFSDNTHNSHYYNAKGIENVYLGQYGRIGGASLYEMLSVENEMLANKLKADIQASVNAGHALVKSAKMGQKFDQLIAEDNTEGHDILQKFIDALMSQTKTIEQAVAKLGLSPIELKGSDSLDNPNAVQ